MKKVKTVTKSNVAKPTIAQKEKVFLAYDADTHTLVEGYKSMESLVRDYRARSNQNANLAWVAVESDIVSMFTVENRINIRKV